MEQKIKVLIGKPGLDGHDRGAKVIANALKDAGMEVVYTGLRQTVASIVETAIQEDVDVIGLSVLSGAHNILLERLMEQLKEAEIEDVLILVGGIIPGDDKKYLQGLGVDEIFGPGSKTRDIIAFIESNLKRDGANIL